MAILSNRPFRLSVRQAFRLSLRSFLIVTTLLSMVVGWVAREVRHGWELEEAVNRLHFHSFTCDTPRPNWLRACWGDYFMATIQGGKGEVTGHVDLVYLDRLSPAGLRLAWDQITDKSIARLTSVLTLRELELQQTSVTDDGLALLKDLPSLESLSLICNDYISDTGLEHLVEVRGLQRLSIRGGKFTDKGLAGLAGIRSLEELVVDEIDCDDSYVAALCDRPSSRAIVRYDSKRVVVVHLHEQTNSRMLIVRGLRGWISDEKLEQAPPNCAVIRDGFGLAFTDEAATCAARFKVRNLRLRGPMVTDEALTAVGNMKHLEDLTISETRITDAGLGNLKKLVGLKNVVLARNTGLTDAALVNLNLDGLGSLRLSGKSFTDAALPHLKQLISLQCLKLDGTAIRSASAEKLRHALPVCDIWHW